jgi:hypothetical protein
MGGSGESDDTASPSADETLSHKKEGQDESLTGSGEYSLQDRREIDGVNLSKF